MKKPVLVVMAAGMGSRYGGLKQMDPVDEKGHVIIDFSIYDAYQAGFEKVVFIIKKENEELFREKIGNAISNKMEVAYVFQELERVPEGYQIPEGRVKPFGTAHAILCCKEVVDGPFAVINADDYYGKYAFQAMYEYLSAHPDDDKYRYTMVGYTLKNTITENGYVSRGICETDASGALTDICERTRIEKHGEDICYSEDGGETFTNISGESTVSMNLWGFQASIFKELEERYKGFFEEMLKTNPLKGEYFIPSVVDALIREGKASVHVLTSQDKWYGVTYKEDKETVVAAIASMKEKGDYPEDLWK